RTTSFARRSVGLGRLAAYPSRSRRSMTHVAFAGSHSHRSASAPMVCPDWRSRLISALESLGVSPRRARLCVRVGAVPMKKSNIERQASAATAALLLCRAVTIQSIHEVVAGHSPVRRALDIHVLPSAGVGLVIYTYFNMLKYLTYSSIF